MMVVFLIIDVNITTMIARKELPFILDCLTEFPAVALLGPRQCGKTTLAQHIAQLRREEGHAALYMDLETSAECNKLLDPAEATTYLEAHENQLIILDEIHRVPELFQSLRGLIDRGIARGTTAGRFLILGSASMDLLRQSGESLAGRIAYTELAPFNVLEVPSADYNKLWVRGGFPTSFLAEDDEKSFLRRQSLSRTYLERDIPQLGPRIPAETLRRLWTMVAHSQSGLLNASQLANSIGVSSVMIARYLDLLVDLLLVRRLQPYYLNVRKRLIKSPKTYLRGSGLMHALLGLRNQEDLLGHPIAGASWEGFVLENLLNTAANHIRASFYRTVKGAEIDLVLEISGNELWAVEIKRSSAPKVDKGFYFACEDLKPRHAFVVYPGEERYLKAGGVEVIGLREMAEMLATGNYT